ncbi:YncE family protein [Streptomyces xanthii]|uniref:Uncharacterized protein n=1 Tax=Streptomyces xanthii TaxID=2768069 RepID=A0A7H1B338_9ACTN|nr:hypothetical protein [Streptomyces xanthii]QNS03143.1 hypothetical protein IAG42_05570 [Streptomyces xanthii]
MQEITPRTPDHALRPYARIPSRVRTRLVRASTVDAAGHAHWLLAGRDARAPYEARVVSVAPDGTSRETALRGVGARFPKFDALPDGGFVVASARAGRTDTDQVQVFDALGEVVRAFHVGDAIEHLLADEAGHLWVGHFDEGVYADDELSHAGLRRWSSGGDPLWSYLPPDGTTHIADLYALNVVGTTAWSCAYTDFALVHNRPGRPSVVRKNPVRAARALAVHGDRVVFLGGYGDDHDRLVDCDLVGLEVRPVTTGRLTRPGGAPLKGRRRVVARGPRIYVQEAPCAEWWVFGLSAL